MKNKYKIILIICVIIGICSILVGSIAYYRIVVEGNIKGSTGNAVFVLKDENSNVWNNKEINLGKVNPGDSGSFTVTMDASGSTVGMYMKTEGVLIIDTGEVLSRDGKQETPAEDLVKPGDYIVAFDQNRIQCKQDLLEDLSDLCGESVTLKVRRGKETIPLSLTPVKDEKGKYKLGIWVRDDTQGIGTLTYVDENGGFGALGHGISDVDTGELLSIADGNLYNAQILGIRKGEKGNPGELSGLIRYEADNILGEISENSKNGIFGTVDADQVKNMDLKKIPVGYKQDLKIGPASVLCCTDGEVKEYAAEITRIDMNHEDSNKSFVIQITDKELLEKTGGIVQGMSGSPVLQNGKLFGAVTHVFVQDSTGGYGIFIENMTGNA